MEKQIVPINHFTGIQFQLEIKELLTIITGTNGTYKTKSLEYIRGYYSSIGKRVKSFSPLRNSQKEAVETALQSIRSQSKNEDTLENTMRQALQDASIAAYPSIADLICIQINKLIDSGSVNGHDATKKIIEEVNCVVDKIFSDIKITGEYKTGVPNISVSKKSQVFTLQGLSCGENAILSLCLSIYFFRENSDVFIIDEPELHLNWSLELKLFNFFYFVCSTYDKQIICTTHSRATFRKEFKKNVIFLDVDENYNIVVTNEPSETLKKEILGEFSDIISLGEIIELGYEIIYFVEDEFHKKVVQKLLDFQNKNGYIHQCGSCSNVINFAKMQKCQSNVFYLVDGDNNLLEGSLRGRSDIIKLEYYCLQNYFADFSQSSQEIIRELLINKPPKGISIHILKCLSVNQFTLEWVKTIDFSNIFQEFWNKLGYISEDSFIDERLKEDSLRSNLLKILKLS